MRRFIRNKKGDGGAYSITSKWLYYIVAILLVTFLFYFFVAGSLSLIDKRTDVYWPLEQDIFTSQVVNVCFSYVEDEGGPTEKRYQNIIDLEKFTLEQLEKCTTKGTYITINRLDDTSKTYELKQSRKTPEKDESRYILLKDGDALYPATIEVRI